MNRPLALGATLLTTSLLLATADASATNFTLWIHGRNTSGTTQPGNYANFSYWGPASTAAGVNKKAVNWDGVSRLADSNFRIRNALDCFCTGSNFCYIAAHSTGDPQIGYALSLFGGTTRSIRNASADASGVCGTTGGTQTGWNIKWIDVGGGAAGGTELANIGAWAVSDPITSDLKTGTVRPMYNHNATQGAWFYMFAGSKGTLYSGTLPGQDDEVIAYHSSGGVSATGSFCNPGDLFCGATLGTGTAAAGTSAKWGFHTTQFRDDSESHNHYTSGNWAGIMGVVRQDVVSFAL
jgi:hypothetical protein